ncbi:MAG: NYN domain-containing protein [Candidatus Saccharibacteria bacterium]|nr:NYN domain-containing protein [Candidatus Saccharibacteria bacterium]
MAKRFFTRKPKQPSKTYAFIDSQNLNVSVQKVGWKVDWKKFRQYLRDKHGVDEAFMFIGYVPDFEPMYEQLHEAGFRIVLKQTFDLSRPQIVMREGATEKEKKAAEEEMHIKGNVDADLVLWAMREFANYKKAVLVSGDGDFRSLLDYLEEQGKLGKILVPSEHYSALFNKFKDRIVDLTANKSQLEYHDKRSRGKHRPSNKKQHAKNGRNKNSHNKNDRGGSKKRS